MEVADRQATLTEPEGVVYSAIFSRWFSAFSLKKSRIFARFSVPRACP